MRSYKNSKRGEDVHIMTMLIERANPAASVGVHSINSFALSAPDIGAMADFIDAFGLRVQKDGEMLLVRGSGSEHVWARILPGSRKSWPF